VTYQNISGAGDLVHSDSLTKIAVCGLLPGSIQVFSQDIDIRPTFIQAHQHPITLLKFSPDSSLVASTSEKGTIIRIFDTTNSSLINVFRRGTFSKQVVCMAFSPSNRFFVAVSENTVHLFDASEKCTDEIGRKSISKMKIEGTETMDICFQGDFLINMINSFGVFFKIDIKDNKLMVSESKLVFSHE